jgi:Flp pilus assembly protein TadG
MATGTIVSLIVALLGAVAGGFKLWQAFYRDKKVEDAFQAGADSTKAKVNAETVEVQDAVESVPRPTDSAVADSLRNGKF